MICKIFHCCIRCVYIHVHVNHLKKQCDEAEALFMTEEFEAALVIYHRILKERPNCAEAKLGIRRCTHCLNSMLVGKIIRINSRLELYV